jgi:pSer/pThr/pTyr-binding forkhead associated (FHA) protein
MSEPNVSEPGLPLEVRISGQAGSWTFDDSFQIGRGRECAVVVEGTSVSDKHVEISREGTKWWAQDLGSTNGTFTGATRIDRFELRETTAIRLGFEGPTVVLTVHTGPGRRPTTALHPTKEQIYDRYLSDKPPARMGKHTAMFRAVLQRTQVRRVAKYRIALAALVVLATAIGALAYRQQQMIARQRAAAAELFYAMKSIEVELARVRRETGDVSTPGQGAERQDLQQRYLDVVEELGIYSDRTPEEVKLIYRVVSRFGESEVNVPQEFVDEVLRYIERWRLNGRLPVGISRAEENGYAQTIAKVMLEEGLPPHFYYLALQESLFNEKAVGPPTRFGFAKGMWQLIPGTAREYGLTTGPLVGVRRHDPRDERHDVAKATRAASRYLRDLYDTDAQASGLLVMASYNWGQTNVLRLLRTLPENPRDRNWWRLIKEYRHRIPDETYGYVLSIVSAAVIGENPSLFGFDFPRPLRHAEQVVADAP